MPVQPLLAQLDPERLRQAQARYGTLPPDAPELWRHYAKYLDVERHVRQNIRRAQDLNLHRAPRLSLLDIGCGGGFFLFVAQALGHRALGIDVAGIPAFDELVDLLGVERVVHKVTAFERLPDFGRKFDLVTSFATAFHGGKEDDWRWPAEAWEFFLRDLKERLNPGGRVFFELNAAYGGNYYTPEIRRVFEEQGGRIERGSVLFTAAG